jgi:radical SAM-linked protein
VAKVALRYGKSGPLRFASHRVLQRAFERAVRRAAVPIAYSAGFTPHPRLSYLGAAPTGDASHAEYLLLRLTEDRPAAEVAAALDAALPRDVPVFQAVTWDDAVLGDLSSRLTHSLWRLELLGLAPGETGADQAVDRFMALGSYEADRSKTGPPAGQPGGRGARRAAKPPRRVDVRAAVVSMTLAGPACPWDTPAQAADEETRAGCVILDVVLRHATPAVRPKDIFAALANNGLDVGASHRATRLAQGQYSADVRALIDPLPRPNEGASGAD